MKAFIRKRISLVILLLLLLLIISMILAVGMGPVKISFSDVWRIIFAKISGKEITDINHNIQNIVWQLRTPRVILGMLVGGGLALSGVGMQAFTRNPLSGPYVLGISSGASAGAVLAVLTGKLRIFGIFALPAGAFLGALLTIFLVYVLSKGKEGVLPIKLILTGIAVSALFTAFTNFLMFNAKNESGIRNATFWIMGGLSGSKWIFIVVPMIAFIIAFVVFYLLSNALNAILIGDATAVTLGINVKLVRRIVIVTTAFLTGSIVAVSGSISFVGLVIPHIVRTIVGTDHRKVVPVASLIGSIFLIWTDVLARTLAGSAELPIGILTAMLGAPFFIWLVRKSSYSFGD